MKFTTSLTDTYFFQGESSDYEILSIEFNIKLYELYDFLHELFI
jgi:hypothetical protein